MATVKRAYFQHGDVIVRSVKNIPADARATSRRVLAEGEATGHAHRLVEDADVEVYEREGTLFLRVGPAGAGLTHEEHGLGIITPGLYEVGRVREFDHFKNEAREVRD
jgi:hypothetical protein